MSMPARLPRLFIASSVEGLATAYHLQENLEFDAETTVWTQGIFEPSKQALTDLVAAMHQADFAAFIFSPDDVLTMRGKQTPAARDNVIFELGLFAGHLGIEHCFVLHPRNVPDLHFPSDLLGLTTLTFETARSDRNLLASLGPASNKIRRVMHKERPAVLDVNASTRASPSIESNDEKLSRLIALWESESLQQDRQLVRQGMPNWIGEDETGQYTSAFGRICVFLDSLAELLLGDARLQIQARRIFEQTYKSVWSLASTYYINAPNSDGEEYWAHRDMPPMKHLVDLWS